MTNPKGYKQWPELTDAEKCEAWWRACEERDRLRAALEEIKNWGDASMDGEPCTWCTNHPAACAIKIAREALSGEPPSPAEPSGQPEIVGWMVGDPGKCPAMYNLAEREKAFDAAKRWDRPITALVLDPRAPDFPTPLVDRAPMRTALEFIRDGLIPQDMSAKLFAERVLAQCSEKSDGDGA